MIAACRRHHDQEIGLAGQCPRDGEIPRHLVDQQYPGSAILQQPFGQCSRQPLLFTILRLRGKCIGPRGIAVVFGNATAHQLISQALGTGQHLGLTRGGDQLFKPTRLAGIVIDTDRVSDQRYRLAPPGGVADITDKAILQLPVGQPQRLRLLFYLCGIGLLAPADQHIARLWHALRRGLKSSQWLAETGRDLPPARQNAAGLCP